MSCDPLAHRWTPEDIEQRFRDAAATYKLWRRGQSSGLPEEYGSSWPAIVRNAAELFAVAVEMGYEKPKIREIASAAEITAMDEVFQWLEMIGDKQEIARLMAGFHTKQTAVITVLCWRHVLLGRAFGLKWRELGERYGKSRETMRKRHDEALIAVARRLNEQPLATFAKIA